MDQAETQLLSGLDQLDLTLSDSQRGMLLEYSRQLLQWNRRFNLIGKSTEQQLVSRHLLDSLSVIPHIMGSNIIDVGTGAGLPGVPLAIALPDKLFCLLDGNGKKTRFLHHVIGQIGLKNTLVVNERAELYRPERGFDTVISRAYAGIARGLEETSHLCVKGGVWCFMKGPAVEQELRELSKAYTLQEKVALDVPGSDGERLLIKIKAVL